jgi:hypothetical protein
LIIDNAPGLKNAIMAFFPFLKTQIGKESCFEREPKELCQFFSH